MKTEFNILIIEDHPLILDGFQESFKAIVLKKPQWEFFIKEASTCEAALYILQNEIPVTSWDLIFLDIGVPIMNNGKYFSGEDLGIYIRKKLKNTKLLISTIFDNNYRIYTLLKSLDPEGFLIKRESTSEIIETALLEILDGGRFYSSKVLEVMRKNIGKPRWLDEHDRRILYEISIGTKTSNLSKIIPLSQASIARRKRRLKENFEVDGSSDKELIQKARVLGFI